MKQRTPIFMLLAVAILAGGIWGLDYFFKTKPSDPKRLFIPDRSAVTRIAITRSDMGIVIEKVSDFWNLTLPVQAKANQRAIAQLLDDVEFTHVKLGAEDKTTAESPEQLAQFGLDLPRLTINVSGGDKFTIAHIGTNTVNGHFVYARRDGKPDVFRVDRDIVERFGKHVDDYRDRTLLDLHGQTPSRVEVRSTTGLLELQLTDNTWRITRPFQARADTKRFAERMGELTQPSIQSFVLPPAEPLAAYGLAEPPLTVSVWTGESAAHTLLIGAPHKEKPELTYAMRKGDASVFTINTDLAAKLALRLNDIRDRQILQARSAEVDSVEIVSSAETVKFHREGIKWVIKSPTEAPADAFDVRVFLEQVFGLTVKEFVEDVVTDLARFGLDKPVAVISLFGAPKRDQPAPLLGKLLIGNTDAAKGVLHVKRDDEPFVYGVDADTAKKIKMVSFAFYERGLFSFALTDFQKFTIAQGDAKAALSKTDDRWVRTDGKEGKFDVGEFIDALGMLGELRAESYVSDRADALAEFGLDSPDWIVTFDAARPLASGEPAAAAKTYEIRIGKEMPDKRRYAMVAGKPLIFEIKNAVVARLKSLGNALLFPSVPKPIEQPPAPPPQPPPADPSLPFPTPPAQPTPPAPPPPPVER